MPSSPRTVADFLKSSYTNSTSDKSSLEIVRAAAEFSIPASHIQCSHSTTGGTLLHYSSEAGGNDANVMQAQSQLRYKVAIWERSANPEANVRSSGQLAKILPAAGVGEKGLALPAGRCQRRGNQAGCLAEWLAGRLRGWLGDRVAPLCILSLGTTPVPSPSFHPSPLLDGRTHRCLQSSRGQRTASRSL